MFRAVAKSIPRSSSSSRINVARQFSSATCTKSRSSFMKEFIMPQEKGPVEVAIETKLIEKFNPSTIHIVNESHMHAHHAAMKGNTNKETHFRVTLVSNAFEGKSLMQRHRLVYKTLAKELEEGVHALTLRIKTPEEFEKKI